MPPSVSVIIPNRDNERALDLVFQRLVEHTSYPDVEFVVVDDGSTDGSRATLRRWRDSGRLPGFVYEERPPSGVVVTLNRCLELARGELIVQMDADATVETPQWLEKMVDFFTSDDRIGVVSPKVVFDHGKVHAFGVNLVGPEGMYDRGTRILEPAGRRTHHQNVDRPDAHMAPYGDLIAEVDAGIGCCMMYRRADALAAGGYDMGFQPVWFDDLDLALSIRRTAGRKAFFFPHVLVTHRIGLSRPRRRVARREKIQGRVGAALPPRLKVAIRSRMKAIESVADARLRHHYAYWHEKWGWDPLNPDMAEVQRRHGDTEVCWATRPESREAGRLIALRGEAGRDIGSPTYAQAYLRRFGFLPPPAWTTMMPYDHILDVVRSHGLGDLDGDFVEIGVFLGGGVQQLARVAPRRRVVAVDIFAIESDSTPAATGVSMAGLYRFVLGDGDQRELFDAVTAGLDNVEVVVGDSALVDLPCERVAFAHIDGNHSAEYVRSDFLRLWPLTVPGGVVAFDDYGHDLPVVTETVDALRAEHENEIAAFWVDGQKTAFLKRR